MSDHENNIQLSFPISCQSQASAKKTFHNPKTYSNVLFKLLPRSVVPGGLKFRNLSFQSVNYIDSQQGQENYQTSNLKPNKSTTSNSDTAQTSFCDLSSVIPTCSTNSIELDFGPSCLKPWKIHLTHPIFPQNKTALFEAIDTNICRTGNLKTTILSSHFR